MMSPGLLKRQAGVDFVRSTLFDGAIGCREVADLEPSSRQINEFALLFPDSVLL